MRNLLIMGMLLSSATAFSDVKSFSCEFGIENKGFFGGYSEKNDVSYMGASKIEKERLKALKYSKYKEEFELEINSSKKIEIEVFRLLPILASKGQDDYRYLENFDILGFKEQAKSFNGAQDVQIAVKPVGAKMSFNINHRVDGAININRNYSGAFLPGTREDLSLSSYEATYYFTTKDFDIDKQAKLIESENDYKYYALTVDCRFSEGSTMNGDRTDGSILDSIIESEPELIEPSRVRAQ